MFQKYSKLTRQIKWKIIPEGQQEIYCLKKIKNNNKKKNAGNMHISLVLLQYFNTNILKHFFFIFILLYFSVSSPKRILYVMAHHPLHVVFVYFRFNFCKKKSYFSCLIFSVLVAVGFSFFFFFHVKFYILFKLIRQFFFLRTLK